MSTVILITDHNVTNALDKGSDPNSTKQTVPLVPAYDSLPHARIFNEALSTMSMYNHLMSVDIKKKADMNVGPTAIKPKQLMPKHSKSPPAATNRIRD